MLSFCNSPKLETLRFERLSFDPDIFRQLKSAPNLQGIGFVSCSGSIREASDLAFLEDVPNLIALGLTDCQLTDAMLERLLPLQSLKHLNLYSNPDVTQKAFSTLRKLESLKSVSLGSHGTRLLAV